MHIDFSSEVPYYVQVRSILRTQILNHYWKAGDLLPSEAELCEQFHVSRTVIRQALQDLTHEGLIRRRKGKGSIVEAPKVSERLAQRISGFHEDMVDQGFDPETQVLKQHIIPAPNAVAAQLQIQAGTPVYEICRLRGLDQRPFLLVYTYIPQALCPGLEHEDLSTQSLYNVLQKKYKIALARGRRVMQAVPAGGFEAQRLQISKGEPILRLDSISYLYDGIPLEYYIALHRGDRVQFVVDLLQNDQIGAKLPPSGPLVSSSPFPAPVGPEQWA